MGNVQISLYCALETGSHLLSRGRECRMVWVSGCTGTSCVLLMCGLVWGRGSQVIFLLRPDLYSGRYH